MLKGSERGGISTKGESSGEMVMSLWMSSRRGCVFDISRRRERPEERVDNGDLRPVLFLTDLATFLAKSLN